MNLEILLTIIGFIIVFVKWMVTITLVLKDARETRLHIRRLYELTYTRKKFRNLLRSNST